MFNPKEAAEDRYAQHLAILFIAAAVVLISMLVHFNTGLKYWLLGSFGETVPGTILSISENTGKSEDSTPQLENSAENTEAHTGPWNSATVVVEIELVDATTQILSFTMKPQDIHREHTGDLLVTYLPINPKIAYTSRNMDRIAIDGKALLWSLLAGLIITLLAARSWQKWARLRKGLRGY
ncbi:hypothetical protein K1718_10780 [Roseibium porphyridii]|uniref:DUF3592 domain-containing protein n=1 Tax=Roseibium porphyridii TaxID=2866279 RepID=A0ABY8FGX4_9HYPH|nr:MULTISPECIES: hypothetical protein [Stappiaceae]QFT31210.1 hypothetical protein FIV00_12030 [Labrenzia sp. THAF82]WFE91818.1 hypothetical protein K1718_10780 [Roseibium sp. KMA01]